jgi:nucleoside-diphosphate-sugar epimerase
VIVILGLGLIGQAVLSATRRRGAFAGTRLPLSWTDPALRRAHLNNVRTAIGSADSPPAGIDIVWTAGKAGFGATEDQLAQEDEPFRDVLAFAESLAEAWPTARHRFHLMSSAGGLFEGCRLVATGTEPNPRRPYGHAKLRQEAMVRAMPAGIQASIYRPSSVYGKSNGSGRPSLINVLIANALARRVSHLFADVGTLRDYLMSDDAGEFLAGRLVGEAPSGTFLLATGKATAVQEIIHLVEVTLGTRLLLRIDPRPGNAEHMSFCPMALPAGFRPTDLATGIRQMARRLLYSRPTGQAAA